MSLRWSSPRRSDKTEVAVHSDSLLKLFSGKAQKDFIQTKIHDHDQVATETRFCVADLYGNQHSNK